MAILITGANGQLGQTFKYLIHSSKSTEKYYFLSKKHLDIFDKERIKDFIDKRQIKWVLNFAAYTKVDLAEDEKDLADKINHLAVKNLAEICSEMKSKFVHISTDYVFDGSLQKPYIETEETHPLGIYGTTKRRGEIAIQESFLKQYFIIRTSWLYSFYGANFLKTMLKFKDREELSVVSDQFGAPTSALNLSRLILDLIENDSNKFGIYHFSDKGNISWYDFAKEIFKLEEASLKLNPIETKAYPTKAKRPKYSVFNLSKVTNEIGFDTINWKIALEEIFLILKNSTIEK